MAIINNNTPSVRQNIIKTQKVTQIIITIKITT
jgi:hypothetical protein